jgi:GAF domain-containing protein
VLLEPATLPSVRRVADRLGGPGCVEMSSIGTILASLVDGGPTDGSPPELLCRRCVDALPVSGVGMALMTEGDHHGVVAATDGPSRAMEDLQFALGEGPCVEASREGRPVLLPDLASSATRWPGFVPAVLNAGIAAVFALPLQVGGIRLGVLDLYRETSGSLTDGELALALTYADAAIVVLLHMQNQMAPGDGLHPQLADSWGNRPEIHHATGIITVQAGVELADALLLLRTHAFTAGRPILEVAREVVARRLRFDLDPSDK